MPMEPSRPGKRGVVSLVKSSATAFMEDECLTQGAALAYYTVFSLAPLLLTVISVAGLVLGREAVQHNIQGQISDLIGPGAAKEVETMLAHASASTAGGVIGTIIGIIVLIAGASGTFASLQDALNKVWRVKPDPNSGG